MMPPASRRQQARTQQAPNGTVRSLFFFFAAADARFIGDTRARLPHLDARPTAPCLYVYARLRRHTSAEFAASPTPEHAEN